VGTRSRMCLEVGRCGHMGMLLFYIVSMLYSSHIMCVYTHNAECLHT